MIFGECDRIDHGECAAAWAVCLACGWSAEYGNRPAAEWYGGRHECEG